MTESGSEHPDIADPAGGVVQRTFGMHRGICRTHLFCGDRRAAADPEIIRHHKTVTHDTGMFLRRQCVLPVL